MRRKYILAYVECLQHNQMGGNEETKKMDRDLPEATILLFRRLAHTQVHTLSYRLAVLSYGLARVL